MMNIVSTVPALRDALNSARAAGRRIAFVPTMGNLHEGHLELVRRARDLGEHVVVSIFVNPFQFGEGEDYESYPRTEDADVDKVRALGADLVFTPDAYTLYPEGPENCTRVEVPELGRILCGHFRPVFFRGVTTVVNILFNMVQPDVAVFGEKDYQQLLVVRRMVRDLHMPVEVVGVPTVREPDGLAMSSRNGYLNGDERRRAPTLYETLRSGRAAIQRGDRDYPALEARSLASLEQAGFRPDYFSVRRAFDLESPTPDDGQLVILAAAWLGRARLIDNISVS